MSEQNNRQVSTLQRPAINNREDWKAYWKQQGQPWRTEPEIDKKRQHYLAERRAITPDIEKGIYPFKDIKLSRADVEWLLATHKNGRGPVDWNDKSQRMRQGIDLRGADLSCADLEKLPLARTCAGLPCTEWAKVVAEQRAMAATLLGQANLKQAHLEGALWKEHI